MRSLSPLLPSPVLVLLIVKLSSWNASLMVVSLPSSLPPPASPPMPLPLREGIRMGSLCDGWILVVEEDNVHLRFCSLSSSSLLRSNCVRPTTQFDTSDALDQ